MDALKQRWSRLVEQVRGSAALKAVRELLGRLKGPGSGQPSSGQAGTGTS